MSIRWGSLVASSTGEIDYARVRSLVGVLLAIVGGVATVWVVFLVNRQVNEVLVGIMVAACVAPITGGKIADGIATRAASAKILAGAAPGRRESDPGPVGTTTSAPFVPGA